MTFTVSIVKPVPTVFIFLVFVPHTFVTTKDSPSLRLILIDELAISAMLIHHPNTISSRQNSVNVTRKNF